MRHLLLAFGFAIIICGCKKAKQESAPTYLSIIDCHNADNPDSLTMLNRLKGNWKLIGQNCGWAGVVDVSGKTVKVVFSGNGTYTIAENSTVLNSGTWSLKRNNNFLGSLGVWQLQLSDVGSYYISGALYSCNKYLVIDGGLAVDGCVFTYKKTN